MIKALLRCSFEINLLSDSTRDQLPHALLKWEYQQDLFMFKYTGMLICKLVVTLERHTNLRIVNPFGRYIR